MSTQYTLRDFDFTLPGSLIAQKPASPRDHARLLVYERATKKITDDYFYNLTKYLPDDATLVLNDSKVEKCRMRFGTNEIFVTETMNPTTIRALVHPGRKFRLGNMMIDNFSFEILDITDDGLRTIRLDRPIDDKSFDPYRLTPLPPYIAQNEKLAPEYQTVYADPLGSKAAPTAGLHFTPKLLKRLEKKHTIVKLTLHVGLGTFSPVKSENLNEHIMHAEEFFISATAAAELNNARHITAVGTTSVRTLESARHPYREERKSTDIFITPGYKFTVTDSLITNFHLPKSTLLMLVSAFIGSVDELNRIYGHAINENYRFYSFGDSMLII